MGRPKGRPNRAAAAPVEPEEESQEVPTEDEAVTEFNAEHTEPAASPAPTDGRSVNQSELVRKAVAAGHEKPAAGVAYIKQQFGIDIDPRYYSVAKSQLKKREPATSQPEKPRPQPSARPAGPSPGVIPPTLFDDMKRLREIKNRYGADEFAKLVEFLG